MASQLSAQDILRIQFRKNLGKGYVNIAELDPTVPPVILAVVESDENFPVRVNSTKGQRYWFSDRRILSEDEHGLHELLRYEAVIKAHWMFKDFWTDRVKALDTPEKAGRFKSDHFDRLEVELPDRLVVLEGLEQSYWPVLHFFWWMTRA